MRAHPVILAIVAALAVAGVLTHKSALAIVVVVVACYLILRLGVVMLGGLARPVPDAHPGRRACGR